MSAANLPAGVHVIVRDWLNSNQIVLVGDDCNAVIDSGYGSHAGATSELLARHHALAEKRIDWLINTHCHSDHMGGNAELRRKHACRTSIPAGEALAIERWDERELWLSYTDQRCERFAFDDVINAGDTYDWAGLDWISIAAPGHDMHAMMFYCESEGILISGDALWENGFGVLLPGPERQRHIDGARTTLDTIASLDARVVIPGHGQPFSAVERSLATAYARLEALAADELRMVRSLLRTMFMFSLLEHQRMAIADLPRYVESVALYREFNNTYLRLSSHGLAHMLVAELEKTGALSRSGGDVRPRVG